MFTARYGLIPYIQQITFVSKRLISWSIVIDVSSLRNSVNLKDEKDLFATFTGPIMSGIFVSWLDSPSGSRPSLWGSSTPFRHTTLGRTPLDEWTARRRDLYLTTHNTLKRLPCALLDSNPQSQQASGSRPMLYTARPLGPASVTFIRT